MSDKKAYSEIAGKNLFRVVIVVGFVLLFVLFLMYGNRQGFINVKSGHSDTAKNSLIQRDTLRRE